jgi:hypothetical protein
MSKHTKSEILFEKFCNEAGVSFTLIPPEPKAGRQTPDYELHLQVPPILAEVKQIDLNPEDKVCSAPRILDTGVRELSWSKRRGCL